MWNATKLRTSNGFTWIGQGYVHVSVLRGVRVCVEHVFARSPSQAKPWRAGITMKIRIFLLALDSVLIEQYTIHMMEASMVEKRAHNAISIIYGLSTNMTETEKAARKKARCEDVGVRDSWKNSSTRICVWVCVSSFVRLWACVRMCKSTWKRWKANAENVAEKSERDDDGVSLLDEFNRR